MLRSYRNSSSENRDKGWKVHTTSFSSNCSFLRAEQMSRSSQPASLMPAHTLRGYPLPPGRYRVSGFLIFFSHSDISKKAYLGPIFQLPADVIYILGSQTWSQKWLCCFSWVVRLNTESTWLMEGLAEQFSECTQIPSLFSGEVSLVGEAWWNFSPHFQSSSFEFLLPVKVDISCGLVLKEMLVRIGVIVHR